MGNGNTLKTKVTAVQRNAGALLKLLGGTDDERLRFWEIVKGITTPAELLMVDQQLDAMQVQLTQLQKMAKGIEKSAKQIG